MTPQLREKHCAAVQRFREEVASRTRRMGADDVEARDSSSLPRAIENLTGTGLIGEHVAKQPPPQGNAHEVLKDEMKQKPGTGRASDPSILNDKVSTEKRSDHEKSQSGTGNGSSNPNEPRISAREYFIDLKTIEKRELPAKARYREARTRAWRRRNKLRCFVSLRQKRNGDYEPFEPGLMWKIWQNLAEDEQALCAASHAMKSARSKARRAVLRKRGPYVGYEKLYTGAGLTEHNQHLARMKRKGWVGWRCGSADKSSGSVS